MVRLALRAEVFKRDLGVCAACELDTNKVRRVHDALFRRSLMKDWRFRLFLIRLERWMIRHFGHSNPACLWQADHIVPVTLGGEDTLANLRTLCIPCHKVESKRLARYRKDRRDLKREHFPQTWKG
jgi:hypothetical protein